MRIIDSNKLDVTLAHSAVPRKSLMKVGDSKTKLQTVNDAYLDPGQGFEPHIHDDSEEIYYFLEGVGEMLVNGKIVPVKEGVCLQIEIGESHGLTNTGSSRLRFLTIRLHV